MAMITAQTLTACGVRPEDRESRAQTALYEKYHREFEITEVFPQKFGDLYYEVQAYAVEDPEIRFTASVDTEDDAISDNYVERRICARISRKVEENLDSFPAYFYVFTHAVGPQPIADDPDMSIRDYVAMDSDNRFRIELFAQPEQRDAAALYRGILPILHDLDYIRCDVELYLVNGEQMEAVQEFFENNDDVTFEFSLLMENCPVVDLPCEGGQVSMSEEQFVAAVGGVL